MLVIIQKQCKLSLNLGSKLVENVTTLDSSEILGRLRFKTIYYVVICCKLLCVLEILNLIVQNLRYKDL